MIVIIIKDQKKVDDGTKSRRESIDLSRFEELKDTTKHQKFRRLIRSLTKKIDEPRRSHFECPTTTLRRFLQANQADHHYCQKKNDNLNY